MTTRGIKFLLSVAGVLALLAGCAPEYPACNNDEHCQDRNQVCIQGTCKQCRDDSQCNAADKCMQCSDDRSCERKSGCCTSDNDCPGGSCWQQPGTTLGQCGPQCGPGKACPPGQRCNGQGQCEPDVECGANAPCPAGKRCDGGTCVSACTLGSVNFDFNQSRIRLDMRDTLNNNAECIKADGRSVRVEGHGDERGTEEYNMALGEKRANATKKYLGDLGISGGSMRTMSYGEERPVCTESNETCWAQNRRADLEFE